jgi:alpha-beta hydrolase superfamily lysophospholipase
MLDRPHLEEEGDGTLIATLLRSHEPSRRRAILHVHGWNEYFYQPHLAQFWENLGYDFYAIDLHRYGRSFQEGELFGYMESVEDYYQELDAAVELIANDHPLVLLSGHSTGGLTAAIFAQDRPKTFAGVVLNSPWIDLQGSSLFRALTPPIMKGLAVASPTMVIPMSESDLYGRTLHKDFYGEWDFDLRLKRNESQPLRPGWLRAVMRGHDRVADGLHIDCPVLVVTSTRSSDTREYGEEAMSSDLALDVDRIAARIHLLGWHVTLVRLAGALHDVCMSSLDVRNRFFDEVRRWDLAYVRGRAVQDKAAEAIRAAEAMEG